MLWRDRDVSVLETDEAVWDRVFAINLKGMVWVCKYGIPHLIAAGGGAIVNVGSTSALLGDTIPQDAYTASKGAVISLTRNLAVQFGPRASGRTASTRVHRHADADRADGRPGVGRGRDRRDPLGRLATARDIVNAALFLASDEAAYVTGTELVVDGGAVVV